MTEATDLPSPLMLPAISKDCSSNKSFLFSFASPSKSYESIIYAMIVPASICIWSSCLDYSSPLATLEGRPFSYTVVAFGSSGSIIECSFKSSPQQVSHVLCFGSFFF